MMPTQVVLGGVDRTAYLTALVEDFVKLNAPLSSRVSGLLRSTAILAPKPPAQGALSETLENGTTLVQTVDAGALVVEGPLVRWLETAAKQAQPHTKLARQMASGAEYPVIGGLRDALMGLGQPQADAQTYLEGIRQGKGLLILEGPEAVLEETARNLEVEYQLWTTKTTQQVQQQEGKQSPAVATGDE